MSINKQEELENLERLRNEVNMPDDDYNLIKNIINEEDEPYNSPYHTSRQNRYVSSRNSLEYFFVKVAIIFVIIVSIVISLIWHLSSVKSKRENHPFTFHSAQSLCIMSENEFKKNLETADLVILNNAINELNGRLKYINNLNNDAYHLKKEKEMINNKLVLLKNKKSELEK